MALTKTELVPWLLSKSDLCVGDSVAGGRGASAQPCAGPGQDYSVTSPACRTCPSIKVKLIVWLIDPAHSPSTHQCNSLGIIALSTSNLTPQTLSVSTEKWVGSCGSQRESKDSFARSHIFLHPLLIGRSCHSLAELINPLFVFSLSFMFTLR